MSYRHIKNWDQYLLRTVLPEAVPIWGAIRSNTKRILEGRMLVLDPSSGSYEHSPAYSMWERGKLVDAKAIPVPGKYIGRAQLKFHRAHHISSWMRDNLPAVDICVVECTRDEPDSKTVMQSFVTLKGIEMTMAAAAVPRVLEDLYYIALHPTTWRLGMPADYVKDDIQDSIQIGQTVIAMAIRAAISVEARANPDKITRASRLAAKETSDGEEKSSSTTGGEDRKSDETGDGAPPKRGRGRPRKSPVDRS